MGRCAGREAGSCDACVAAIVSLEAPPLCGVTGKKPFHKDTSHQGLQHLSGCGHDILDTAELQDLACISGEASNKGLGFMSMQYVCVCIS